MLLYLSKYHMAKVYYTLLYTFIHIHVIPVHAGPCSYPAGLRYKECSPKIAIDWYDIPPYVYNSTNMTGILKTLTEKLVKQCCGSCVEFEYNEPVNSSAELIAGLGRNNSDSVVTFPVYGTITTSKFGVYPYIPLVESPGIIYIIKRPTVGKASKLLLKSVTDCWPILVLTFLLAILFGIITWATDSYVNPEQFPSPFFKGAWDGFWWALVSMTTVGYGDKAPVGYAARIIAFVWILIGLVLFAVFSGSVSTSSTASALGHDVELYGKKVVAMNNSQEQRLGIKSNAKVMAASTMSEFYKSIKNGSVTGGLIDSYSAGFHEEEIIKQDLIAGTVIDYQFTYGFVLTNELNSKVIERCIWVRQSLEEKYILNLIETNMNTLPELSEAEIANLSTTLFDAQSGIFIEFVIVICVMLGVMCFCGVLWEVLYNRPRLAALQKKDLYPEVRKVTTVEGISEYKTMDELIIGQNMELQQAMLDEINSFLKAFNRREKDFCILHSDPMFRKMLPRLMEYKDLHFIQYS